MARRRHRRGARHYYRKAVHRVKSMTLPLAPIAGLAVGVAPAINDILTNNTADGKTALENAVGGLAWRYIGYNPGKGYGMDFDPNGLAYGLFPLIAGGLIHKFVGGTLGINRMLGQAGVPLIRL